MTSLLAKAFSSLARPSRLACILAATIAAAGACATTDGGGDRTGPPNFGDGGSDGAEDPCALVRCSLDGRSVVRNCTDEVVTTCTDDLACGGGECVEPCLAAERERGSRGCDFFFQPPPAYAAQQRTGCYAAFLVNASAQPSTIHLEYQGKELDLGKAVWKTTTGENALVQHDGPIAPGEAVVVFVADPPARYADEQIACPPGVVPATVENPDKIIRGISSSFHLTTTVPVSASTIFPFGGGPSFFPSATLLLPVSTWGKEHVVIDPWPMGFVLRYDRFGPFPATQIVAKDDDTDIEIRPSADIQDDANFVGAKKGIPVHYKLNRGQYLQVAQPDELTGSIVTSSKPTSVFGAHACMFIPVDIWACDTAQQQIPSFAQWGSEYAAAGYPPRLGPSENMPYRVIAAVEGTELTYDPAPPQNAPTRLEAGKVATFWTRDPFVVRSQDNEHPIYMAAYMTGADNLTAAGGTGDPEFVNVIATAQYLNDYSFFADPTYPETSLVVIREKTSRGFEDVQLDCAQGPIPGFVPLGNEGRFEYVRLPITKNFIPQKVGAGTCGYGIQRMRSRAPFTSTIWGTGEFASYALPGGVAQRTLVKRSLVIR